MCGIFGGHDQLLHERPEQLLAHRGPNQAGRRVVDAPGGSQLTIGQTRLSVVYKGDVPTPLERDGAVIAYNGEVYNWLDLRADLEAKGWQFHTPTDTEVVLVAFLEWGAACLERFNGMFAFAIWHAGRLFLARDRVGEKPLFYAHHKGQFAFGSELKVLRGLEYAETPICKALEFYFDEHTPFRNVKSVRPGAFVEYTPATGEVRETTYWTFPVREQDITEPDAAIDAFLELFTDACRIRKVADVPVTVFLSGGIDSSLIQAVVGVDATYTIQFAEFAGHIDEEGLVREFAASRGFEARVVTPTRQQFLDVFPDLARHIEFPVGSFSVFPLFCLAQRAREGGFVVALSGEGSDELFNGYYRNELLLREAARIAGDLAGPYATLSARYFGSEVERFSRMASRQGFAGVPLLVDFFGPRWDDALSMAQNLCAIETTVFLQPLLVMADRLSMGSALEVRSPFLDPRLIELSARLADDLKFRDGQGKWLLRRALERLVGKDLGIARRTIKHGLPAPVNQWLFKSSAFDRNDWNHVLLGECLKQLARLHDPSE